MLYVKSRKNFEIRRKKIYYFAVCKKTHGKFFTLPYAKKKAHGKEWICGVLCLCRVCTRQKGNLMCAR